jgi:hypothetical protein
MTRCQPDPAQVAAALFAASYGGHWCTSWQAHTREDGSPVIRCSYHRIAIELGEAT